MHVHIVDFGVEMPIARAPWPRLHVVDHTAYGRMTGKDGSRPGARRALSV